MDASSFVKLVSDQVGTLQAGLDDLRRGEPALTDRQKRAVTTLQIAVNVLGNATRTLAANQLQEVAGADNGTHLRLEEVFKSLLHAMSRMQDISDHSSDQDAKQLAEQARRELINAWVGLTLIMTGLPKGTESPDSAWALDTLARILAGNEDFVHEVAGRVAAELRPEEATT